MKLKRTISLLLIFILCNSSIAQKKKKKIEIDPNTAFKMELAGYKKNCRIALKPYRYDGVKTTYFTYKTFEYLKEIEVATIKNSEYRLSFNARGISNDKIKIKIYDKPSTSKGRVLLYEKTGVGGNEFTFETADMVTKLKTTKIDRGVDPAIVERMRLKKIYVDYIIPANDRTTETNEFGKEVQVKKKGAIILCIGYSNL